MSEQEALYRGSMRHSNSNWGGSGVSAVIVVIVVVILSLLAIYLGWVELGSGILERVPPQVTVVDRDKIVGIGTEPREFVVEVSDIGMGLDEIIVRAEQKQDRFDLGKQKFNGEKENSFRFTLGGVDSPFDEGEVEIEVRAFDRSFWSNATSERFKIVVDKHRPQLSVITAQHNAQEGGSQLVIYKARDTRLKSSGVVVGEKRFYGFKAQLLDNSIKDENAYGVIYAVPPGGEKSERSIHAFAEDSVGNITFAKFYNKVFARKFRKAQVSIPEQFLTTDLPALLEPYKLEREALKESSKRSEFKLLNEIIRKKDRARINSNTILAPLGRRTWGGHFLVAGGSPQYRFGEELTYSFNGEAWSTVTSDGFILQHSNGVEVYPGQEGEVIFAEPLSVYGKCVIIDHGLGISSIYGGLGSILVKKGEKVRPERAIGTVGSTGIFFKPSYYFEMRVQGQPVTPLEWWDKDWVKSHIENKIEEGKRLLGYEEVIDFE